MTRAEILIYTNLSLQYSKTKGLEGGIVDEIYTNLSLQYSKTLHQFGILTS